MATEFCQKCQQAHPGRACDYDEKGECAETLAVSKTSKHSPRNQATRTTLLRKNRRRHTQVPFTFEIREQLPVHSPVNSGPRLNGGRDARRTAAPRSRFGAQAFAGSNPETCGIFVATSTSSRVAVLRTLPEMVINASEMRGCCSASKSRRSLTL